MEMYLWDNYKQEDITPALKYWTDYWVESVDFYGAAKEKVIFENPNTLMGLIKDEIDFNGLQSREVKDYFLQRVKHYLINNYLLGEKFLGYFKILESSISSGTTELLFWNASACQKEMKSGEYVRYLVDFLERLLLSNGDLEKIRRVSDALIVEFLFFGFDIKYIKEIPKKIFSFFLNISDEILTSDYPHGLDLNNFLISKDIYDFKSFNNEVRKIIIGLTLKDRLLAILKYYFVEQEDFTYIFQLRGARGDVGEVRVGNVHIYSPKSYTYSKNVFDKEREEFSHNNLEFTPANVAVTIKAGANGFDSFKEDALFKIRDVLNLLQFFSPGNVELSIEDRRFIVVDLSGKIRYQHSQVDKNSDFWFWNDKSIEISDFHADAQDGAGVFKEFFNQEKRSKLSEFSFEQISHALHFFNKANRDVTAEDRLLNLWVSLEKIVADRKTLFSFNKSKYDLIFDSIPYVVLDSRFEKGWSCFNQMRKLYSSSQGNRRLLPLSLDLAQRVNFETNNGDSIYLKNFIDNLDEISSATDKEFIREKLVLVKDYYFDRKKAAYILNNELESVKRDLLLIYRMRNKIVHDAHFNSIQIRFLAERLSFYVQKCLSALIDNYCKSEERNYDYMLQRKVAFLHECEMLKNGTGPRIYDLAFI